jgi:alpha-glucuronidase
MNAFLLRQFLLLFLLLLLVFPATAEDGYRLWLRYDQVSNPQKLRAYRTTISQITFDGQSPTLAAARQELAEGLRGLLGKEIPAAQEVKRNGAVLAGTPQSSALISSLNLQEKLKEVGKEGYLILNTKVNNRKSTVIAANTDVGVLYGVFHFLRLLQTRQDLANLSVASSPRITHRVLNHWDNLDRTVERGYAGFSLWDWHRLPDYLDPRYVDYARANASIGINGTVLTNVNANSLVLTPLYLEKVKALADVFRPYGLKVYLTARFSSPVEIGGLKTADPLNPQVAAWWKKKVEEIYTYVPDFGGFVVKANSEGQPGPQNYGRNHADGANMLADALAPGGVVMWRAFVYDDKVPDDRHKQAYNEFKPLDGQFRKNVFVQVKNGAIDFQPREPFHPLFGAMPQTPLMMEFQLTQEYLGFATHLVYQAPLFKETLDADTHAKGPGSTVAKVVDGTLDNHAISGMAGVANIGNDRNWTGHPFGQATWYAFGRLAWDHTLSSEAIANEWLRMTFSNQDSFVHQVRGMMMASREAVVNYMTPLGLHHLMGRSHHYGLGPWVEGGGRADWTSIYYHRADSAGIGFDRSPSGSNAVAQYFPPVSKQFGSLEQVPEKYLLWFHHVPWDHPMASGRTLWNELAHKYQEGVDTVRWMQQVWDAQQGKIDEERFRQVQALLKIQEKEARWWRDALLLYFQTFSRRPLPEGYEKPAHSLEYYKSLQFPHAPGI